MHTVEEYKGYLSELSRKLVEQDIEATILLFGGGALAFAYGARDKTQDLDVLLQGSGAGYVRLFSDQISNIYGIKNDWINDDGARFITDEIQAAAEVFWRLPNLTILIPPAEALLAMKVLAMRIDPQHPDKDDILFLLRKLDLYDEDIVLTLVEHYLPAFACEISQEKRLWLTNLIEIAKTPKG